MATRFWVGGTGTWDGSTTTNWSLTSGGAGGQSVPGAADTVTFDGSSGAGTVTVNTTVSVQSISMGTYTGTLDFSVNNNNVTLSGSSPLQTNGSSTRTLNMGNGTWTFNTTSAATPFDFTTMTNFTLNQNGATFLIQPTSAPLGAQAAGLNAALTINNLTINMPSLSASTRRVPFQFFNAGTITNLVVTNAYWLEFSGGSTITLTNGLTINGGSSSQQIILKSQSTNSAATLSVGGAVTCNWCAISDITKAGAGSITATNSFDLGGNSGVTISGPAAGGGKMVGV
jgi:hypothetical protein